MIYWRDHDWNYCPICEDIIIGQKDDEDELDLDWDWGWD